MQLGKNRNSKKEKGLNGEKSKSLTLVDSSSHNQRWRALKASSHSRDDELNVPAHGVLAEQDDA